jgi:hypothetical protein
MLRWPIKSPWWPIWSLCICVVCWDNFTTFMRIPLSVLQVQTTFTMRDGPEEMLCTFLEFLLLETQRAPAKPDPIMRSPLWLHQSSSRSNSVPAVPGLISSRPLCFRYRHDIVAVCGLRCVFSGYLSSGKRVWIANVVGWLRTVINARDHGLRWPSVVYKSPLLSYHIILQLDW